MILLAVEDITERKRAEESCGRASMRITRWSSSSRTSPELQALARAFPFDYH
jgi:hypothetical protein